MSKDPKRKPKKRVTQAVLDGLAKARAVRAAKKHCPSIPSDDIPDLVTQNYEMVMESAQLVDAPSVAQITVLRAAASPVTESAQDTSAEVIILRAISENPDIMDFVTCWELAQAGVQLPPISMDEADAALKGAQAQYRGTPAITHVSATKSEAVFYHTGDMGDIIACLPVIRAMGGGRLVIGPLPKEPYHGRESMEGKRYEAIRPLLLAQPYITGVDWGTLPKSAKNFSSFRLRLPGGENLTLSQAKHVGCTSFSYEPWLLVDPIPSPVIFARSPRYHNPHFDWRAYANYYKDAIFVGTTDEHEAFQIVIGRKIEHRVTPDLLVLARMMAGSPQCLCNQSAPWWCAAGVGAPTVQETCPRPEEQNSRIERARLKYAL